MYIYLYRRLVPVYRIPSASLAHFLQKQHRSSYFIQTCGYVTDVKTRQSSCLFQINNINYVQNKLSTKIGHVL